ncbi:MAG: ATP-binding protein [Formosimonas sp.]
MRKILTRDRIWILVAGLLMALVTWVVVVVYQRISIGEQAQSKNDVELDVFRFEQALNHKIDEGQKQVVRMLTQVQRSEEPKSAFVAQSAFMMNDVTGLTNIQWLDVKGTVRAQAISVFRNMTQTASTRDLLEDEAIAKAWETNGVVTVGPFLMSDGDYEVTVVRPLYNEENRLSGFISCRYSLATLFRRTIPVEFVAKYHLNAFSDNQNIYSTLKERDVHFNDKNSIVERNVRIGDVPLVLKAHLRPDSQVWVVRALFLGMVFLLLLLLASLLALIVDMRRRRRTEKQLAAQNALRQAIETSLPLGIRAHAMNGSIIYSNPAFCQMIGYSEAEVINIPPPLPYIPPEEAPKILAIRDNLLLHPSAEIVIEIKMRKKNGEVIDTIMRGGPMYDENQVHVGWITSVEDVTERLRLEAFQKNEQKRLEKVNHLISMGEMASSIAHELNQPLSAISGYATGLSNYIQKDEQALSRDKLVDVTEKIRRQAERAAQVTRRVQQFAKQQNITPIHLSVTELIDQVIEFMELELRQKLCHITNHSRQTVLPTVYVDNTMAQQILINLVRNAIDSMVDAEVLQRNIDVYVEPYSTHHLVIRVLDSGPGVPKDKVETIFNAFYTTKAQGVGIGLNICRTMIESNGGRLWAKAGTQGGEFFLTMPISQI